VWLSPHARSLSIAAAGAAVTAGGAALTYHRH
jgi:hypothetical protein